MPHDESTPGLPPEEEQVRRLLADARHTEPVPDDVAARLDGVLADLRHEPARADTSAPVVDLAAVRRRRLVRNLLVAAAAVAVIGVGIDRIDLSVSGDSADSTTGGAAAEHHQPDSTSSRDQSGPTTLSGETPHVYRLDAARFGAGVTRLREHAFDRRTLASGQAATSDGPQYDVHGDSAFRAGCRTPALRPGRVVLVRYDRRPGFLVFRPVSGDTQVVDLVLCGADVPTRSITLPAP